MVRNLSKYLNAVTFVNCTKLNETDLKYLFTLADALDKSQDEYLEKISNFKAPKRKPAKTFREAFGNAEDVWVAVVDGRLAGFVAMRYDVEGDERSLYISALYVADDFRGHGVGSALLDFACTMAKQNHDVAVKLQVIATNKPGIALYERFGFIPLSVFYTYPIK